LTVKRFQEIFSYQRKSSTERNILGMGLRSLQVCILGLYCILKVSCVSEPFFCGPGKFRCRSEQCIPMTYKCDKMNDCGDGSDEENCQTATCNPNTEFQCVTSGRCLPTKWRCDNENDCADKSDESNCPKKTCASNFFQCNNTRCIPKKWVCDETDDCGDKSDEHCTTQPKTCQSYQFTCADGSCISKTWKCDGDNDCPDGSDESQCEKANTTCASNEFQCGRQCLPMAWRCDGNKDCHPNGEDEMNCQTTPAPKTCPSDKWQCKNGACISKVWRCDGENDCVDRSDEENCDKITCSPDKFACADKKQCVFNSRRCDGTQDCMDGSDEKDCPKPRVSCTGDHFNCSDGTCIEASKVCDGNHDCAKGEDEPVNCFINECLTHRGHCMHDCEDLKIGFQCKCKPGYKLMADLKSCEDIDECTLHGFCHQKCENTKGSFKCSCSNGFQLEPDRRTCKVQNGEPTVYFSNRQDIRSVSLAGNNYSIAISRLKGVISFDFDIKNEYIYMADAIDETIKRAKINKPSSVETILSNVHTPDGIAVDWITGKLYWTDTGYKTIEVADIDGKHNADLIKVGLYEPRAIAVDPHTGFLYWSDWGEESSAIERMSMDGDLSTRKKIVTDNIKWPNGLTLDLVQQKLYWIDAKLRRLEVADFEGNNRQLLVDSGIAHPFALDNFNDQLFWTDWRMDGVKSMNKFNSSQISTLKSQLIAPMGIKVYHPSRQLRGENPCGSDNNGCSHLCLLANKQGKRSISCVCPRNMTLQEDGKTCAGKHSTRGPPVVTLFTLPAEDTTTTQSTITTTKKSSFQSTRAILKTTTPTTTSTSTTTTTTTTEKPFVGMKTTKTSTIKSTTTTTTKKAQTVHPSIRSTVETMEPTVISNAAHTSDGETKKMGSGVIVAISVTIVVALFLLVVCILYCKRKNVGKRHVMYYKDMSTTPLEEDFDITQDDFSEKAKIIDE